MTQDKSLDTVTALLWKGITDARAKLTTQLQGDGLRAAGALHDTIDEIQAYISALDVLHSTSSQPAVSPLAALDGAPVPPTTTAETPFTPPLAYDASAAEIKKSILTTVADDITSITRGIL